jgi:ketosteroid isomerase-like protein
MADHSVSPSVVQAFYQAFFSREPARIAPFLADDVVWMVAGPADIFPFCGPRRGKAEVLELFERLVPNVFDARSFDPEELLIDGDCVAVLVRISGIQCSTGRVLNYHSAQFTRFRDDKLVSYNSVIDSFNAVEQWIGHPIKVGPDSDLAEPIVQRSARNDVITV